MSDSISAFKSNPYGRNSLSLADQGYSHLVAPFLPYAQRPLNYVKPYVAKADSIADGGLCKVDSTFPIITEDTQKLKQSVLDVVFFPLKLAGSGKDYFFNTYSSEYRKCGGDGYVSGGKAVLSTGLVLTSDGFTFLGSLFARANQHAKGTKDATKEKAGQTKEAVEERTNS